MPFNYLVPYKYQAAQHSLMQMGNVRLGSTSAAWPYERFSYSLENTSTYVSTYDVETNIVSSDYDIDTLARNDPQRRLYKCEVQLHTLYNTNILSDAEVKDVEVSSSFGAYDADNKRVNYMTTFKNNARSPLITSLLVIFSTIQNQR